MLKQQSAWAGYHKQNNRIKKRIFQILHALAPTRLTVTSFPNFPAKIPKCQEPIFSISRINFKNAPKSVLHLFFHFSSFVIWVSNKFSKGIKENGNRRSYRPK